MCARKNKFSLKIHAHAVRGGRQRHNRERDAQKELWLSHDDMIRSAARYMRK